MQNREGVKSKKGRGIREDEEKDEGKNVKLMTEGKDEEKKDNK